MESRGRPRQTTGVVAEIDATVAVDRRGEELPQPHPASLVAVVGIFHLRLALRRQLHPEPVGDDPPQLQAQHLQRSCGIHCHCAR